MRKAFSAVAAILGKSLSNSHGKQKLNISQRFRSLVCSPESVIAVLI